MKSQIKIGALLSYIVLIINTVVTIFYTHIIIKFLGQTEYGLYSLVFTIISYLTILDLGFGNAIIVYTNRYKAKGKDKELASLNGMLLIIYSIIGFITSIIGVLLFVFADKIFGATLSLEEIQKAKTMLLILVFNLAITFPFSLFSSLIVAYEKFIFSKVINILRIILVPIISIPLLYFGYKSVALIVVTTIVNITIIAFNTYFCFKKLKIKIKFEKIKIPLLKEIFAYSSFIFLGTIVDKINWSVDQLILGVVSGTAAVAVYAIASQFAQMYQAFSTAISGVMLPKITKMIQNDESTKEVSNIFIKTGRIQLIIMSLVMTGFILFGKYFIKIWAGPGFETAYYMACILMIPTTIPLIQNVGIAILQAKNKHRFRTILYLIIAIINLLVSIPLAKKIGGMGTAIATGSAVIVGSVVMNFYYHRKMKIDIKAFWREIFKLLVPIIVSFGIGYLILITIPISSIYVLIVEIIIYVLIYASIIYLFGMNKYEKNLIKRSKNKNEIKGA